MTQNYTMYVSLDFIDTFQSTFNTIIKTHFCWDKMVTISHGIFKYIFLNENIGTLNDISLKLVLYGLIENMSALVQIMAWFRTGDKPLFDPMMTQFAEAYMRHPVSMS